jgi:hypothetical protein
MLLVLFGTSPSLTCARGMCPYQAALPAFSASLAPCFFGLWRICVSGVPRYPPSPAAGWVRLPVLRQKPSIGLLRTVGVFGWCESLRQIRSRSLGLKISPCLKHAAGSKCSLRLFHQLSLRKPAGPTCLAARGWVFGAEALRGYPRADAIFLSSSLSSVELTLWLVASALAAPYRHTVRPSLRK